MSKIRFQELLDGVRIDWMGQEIPDRLQAHAGAEVQALRDSCKRMRAITVECRPEVCRVSCNCLHRGKGIRATRPTLLEALWAFEETQRTRCAP